MGMLKMSLEVKEKTESVVDGEVTYEAVECNHCGYDVPIDSSTCFVTSDVFSTVYLGRGDRDYKIRHSDNVGSFAFCPICTESLFGDDVLKGNYDEDFFKWAATGPKKWKVLLFMFVMFFMGVLLTVMIFIEYFVA